MLDDCQATPSLAAEGLYVWDSPLSNEFRLAGAHLGDLLRVRQMSPPYAAAARATTWPRCYPPALWSARSTAFATRTWTTPRVD